MKRKDAVRSILQSRPLWLQAEEEVDFMWKLCHMYCARGCTENVCGVPLDRWSGTVEVTSVREKKKRHLPHEQRFALDVKCRQSLS